MFRSRKNGSKKARFDIFGREKIITLPKDSKLKNIQTTGPSILPACNAKIWHEHDTVLLEVGGNKLTMDYPMAFSIGKLLVAHAKQAKKFAGDYRKQIDANSILTDAEFGYKKNW